jgi:hypothetical protein
MGYLALASTLATLGLISLRGLRRRRSS